MTFSGARVRVGVTLHWERNGQYPLRIGNVVYGHGQSWTESQMSIAGSVKLDVLFATLDKIALSRRHVMLFSLHPSFLGSSRPDPPALPLPLCDLLTTSSFRSNSQSLECLPSR